MSSCKANDEFVDTIQNPVLPNPDLDPVFENLQFTPLIEQSDYSIYKIGSNGRRMVDLMPIYNDASNKFTYVI